MFYLGMRSSDVYFGRIASVRTNETPTDIISVAGGLAFLHAISRTTTSLTVTDVDRDALAHWGLIRALLRDAASLTDFLTLLTGRRATGSFVDGTKILGQPVDLRRRLASALSGEQRAVYDRTYGALTVDDVGIGAVGNRTVRFVGLDLRQDHFNWQFGTGNLADETHFQILRAQAGALPVRVCLKPLETFDYDTDFPSASGRVRACLASNCESPMFTRADAIFLRVMDTARRPVRFVSWQRDAVVEDGRVVSESSGSPARTPLELDPATVVLFRDRQHGVHLPTRNYHRTIDALAELRDRPEYDRTVLLMLGHGMAEVQACLAHVAPAFRQVLWVPAADAVPPSIAFSLPNYRAERAAFERCPAWRFALVGCPDV